MILWPNFPLVKMILLSQVINGVLLPVVLIYMVMLINKRSLMKEWTNSAAYNAIAWVSVAIMIGLTLALASITVQQMLGTSETASVPSSKPLPASASSFTNVESHDPGRHSLKPDVREARGAHLIRQASGVRKFAD